MRMAERALAEQQQQEDGVTYRVATKGHAPDALWELQGAEFAEKALAQEWAHFLLWSAAPQSKRPRNATLVPVVDGVVKVPWWMHLRQEAPERASERARKVPWWMHVMRSLRKGAKRRGR